MGRYRYRRGDGLTRAFTDVASMKGVDRDGFFVILGQLMEGAVRLKDAGHLSPRDAMPSDITKAVRGQGLIELLGDPGV